MIFVISFASPILHKPSHLSFKKSIKSVELRSIYNTMCDFSTLSVYGYPGALFRNFLRRKNQINPLIIQFVDLFPCRYSHSYLHRALPDNLPLQISLIYHSFLIFLPIAVTTLTLALVGCYGNGIAFCLFISIKIYRVCHGTATVSGS